MVRLPPISTLFPYTTLFRSLEVMPRRLLELSPLLPPGTPCVAESGVTSPADVREIAAAGEVTPLSRSEEHTSELQSHSDLVCRLLLEKKKRKTNICISMICT